MYILSQFFKMLMRGLQKGLFFFFFDKAVILARQYPKENTRKYVKI